MTTKQVQYDFLGQTVVVTGASGGIGSATARRFAASGASVALHANRNLKTLETLAAEIGQQGGAAEIFSADLSIRKARSDFFDSVLKKYGHIDIWINAAGLDLMEASVKALPFEKKLRELFELDVFAAIELSDQVGQLMLERKKGTIFFLGWDGVEYGWEGGTAQLYGAAKGAIQGYCRSLAESLKPEVRVCCLSLGWIKTRWGNKASSDFSRRIEQDSLRCRWGTPEDVAETLLFLSSDAAGYIDGIGIRLNGGKRGTK